MQGLYFESRETKVCKSNPHTPPSGLSERVMHMSTPVVSGEGEGGYAIFHECKRSRTMTMTSCCLLEGRDTCATPDFDLDMD
jgi:hypothetical protein